MKDYQTDQDQDTDGMDRVEFEGYLPVGRRGKTRHRTWGIFPTLYVSEQGHIDRNHPGRNH